MKTKVLFPTLSVLIIIMLTSCLNTPQVLQTLSGTIESTNQIIRAQVPGRIVMLNINEGDAVKRSQLIAQIQDDSLKLIVSQQKHLVKIKAAKIDELLNSKIDIADEIITQAREDKAMAQDSLKLAEISLANSKVKSYLTGNVSEVYVSVGDDVAAGTAIAKISDFNDRYGYVYVPQSELFRMKIGRTFKLGNFDASGKIVQIADAAEFTPKNTQTGDSKDNIVFKIKLQITGTKDLRPGMSFEISF